MREFDIINILFGLTEGKCVYEAWVCQGCRGNSGA